MANVNRAKKVIIISDLISNKTPDEIDSQTMMTAMAVDSLGGTYVCAELLNPKYEKYLKLANCDEIIYSSEYSRSLIANASSSTGIVNVYHDLLNPKSGSNLFTETIPHAYISKRYSELFEYFKINTGSVLIGVLENTGSRNALKEVAIREAQKTPDISTLVDNLVSVKKLEYNKPVFTPDDNYIITGNSMAILVGGNHAVG
jgi:voltage-gated potassium channel